MRACARAHVCVCLGMIPSYKIYLKMSIIIIYQMCSMPFSIPQLFFFCVFDFIYCFYFSFFLSKIICWQKSGRLNGLLAMSSFCWREKSRERESTGAETETEKNISNTSSQLRWWWQCFHYWTVCVCVCMRRLISLLNDTSNLIKLEGQFIHQIKQLHRL